MRMITMTSVTYNYIIERPEASWAARIHRYYRRQWLAKPKRL